MNINVQSNNHVGTFDHLLARKYSQQTLQCKLNNQGQTDARNHNLIENNNIELWFFDVAKQFDLYFCTFHVWSHGLAWV